MAPSECGNAYMCLTSLKAAVCLARKFHSKKCHQFSVADGFLTYQTAHQCQPGRGALTGGTWNICHTPRMRVSFENSFWSDLVAATFIDNLIAFCNDTLS